MQNHETGSYNFLEGIDEIGSRGTNRLLQTFINKGIIKVLQKLQEKEHLLQGEQQLLKDFRDSFPSMTLEEVLKFKNKTNKEQTSSGSSWLEGIELD